MFQDSTMMTLELKLPKDPKPKNIQTKLDVSVQELVNRIREEHGLQYITLIFRGKKLSADQRLGEQGVKDHSKIMVMGVTDGTLIKQMQEEEKKEAERKKMEEEKKEVEKKQQDRSFKRTQKGFNILCERDGSEDPITTPYLEIADQRGNPLEIPPPQRKALILAMGHHEKGRALMKRKQHENALCHLLEADQQFRRFDSTLLTSVDNYAVLQLDIVWCYQALEALSCLDDAKTRLQKAEDCFLQCYGEQQQRLQLIKGNTGREQVLFLRLYLLQSLLFYCEGNDAQARDKLSKVESLYGRLCPDSDKMTQLMDQGFSAREARLGLRACQGDLHEAAIHISNRRQEREELRQSDRQKRRRRTEDASTSHRPHRDFLFPSFERRVPPGVSTFTPTEDDELVNEVLGDISRHEEDYLDLTLEEESQLISTMKRNLSRGSAHTL